MIEHLENRTLFSAPYIVWVSRFSGNDANLGTEHYPLRTWHQAQAVEKMVHGPVVVRYEVRP